MPTTVHLIGVWIAEKTRTPTAKGIEGLELDRFGAIALNKLLV
jgi:hypothetical protein